jgi:hypothetical protein
MIVHMICVALKQFGGWQGVCRIIKGPAAAHRNLILFGMHSVSPLHGLRSLKTVWRLAEESPPVKKRKKSDFRSKEVNPDSYFCAALFKSKLSTLSGTRQKILVYIQKLNNFSPQFPNQPDRRTRYKEMLLMFGRCIQR